MAILDGPAGATDQRVVEEVLLCLLNEQLTGLTLERGNPAFLHRFGPRAKPAEKLFDVQLSHCNLLMNWPPG